MTRTQAAEALKVLADPTRLMLVNLLAERPGFQKQLQAALSLRGLFVPQSMLSYHLRKLHSVGLVSQRRRGVFVMYRLAPDRFAALASAVRPHSRRKLWPGR